MRRRLTWLTALLVAGSVVLVGLGTLAIARVRAAATTERELRDRVASIAAALGDEVAAAPAGDEGAARISTQLAFLRRAGRVLRLDDLTFVVFGADGNVRQATPLPEGVTAGELDLTRLRSGSAISWNQGRTVFAAAGTPMGVAGRATGVLVGRSGVDTGLGAAWRWFLLSSAVTVVLGVAAGRWWSGRLARPLRDTTAAAHAIAAGDLATRVPEPRERDGEVADLARSVNTMAAALERSRDLEQQFLLSVSHDLRTPLTSIKGYAEATRDGVGDPRQHAAVITDSAERMSRLVDDLLDLARLRSHRFPLQRQPVDAGEVVAATVRRLQPLATERGVVLGGQSPTAAVVLADEDRLDQIVGNLVANATRYARSRVDVVVHADAGGVELRVDDDGPGISDADLPHVFERLYVAQHDPVRAENSSGMGLAIVKELAEAHGGSVSARRSPLGGAGFTVWLPLHDGP